jgi:hypothetical protein
MAKLMNGSNHTLGTDIKEWRQKIKISIIINFWTGELQNTAFHKDQF